MPRKMVDISWCQSGKIIWGLLITLISGVLIRFSQSNFEDSKRAEHVTNALRVGMPYVPWHFYQPNEPPEEQAATFIELWNTLPWKPKKVAIDVENIAYTIYDDLGNVVEKVNILPPSKAIFSVWLMTFCKLVMQGTGLRQEDIGIYTRADYWNAWVLPGGSQVEYQGEVYEIWDWKKCWLWIASWLIYASQIVLPRDWSSYLVWQKEGGTNRQEGIEGPVDADEFNGDQVLLEETFGVPPGFGAEPVIDPPYLTHVSAAWLTVCEYPDPYSTALEWIQYNTPVAVLEEQSGWGKIVPLTNQAYPYGWINLTYTFGKTSLPSSSPSPSPSPSSDPVDRLTRLEKEVEAIKNWIKRPL